MTTFGRVGHAESSFDDEERLRQCLDEWIDDRAREIMGLRSREERRAALGKFRTKSMRERVRSRVEVLWKAR